MRILANENLPGLAVEALRQRGHDVAWIRRVAPGSSDVEVLARARAEDRVVITFDKDFGELAFRAGLASAPGVVLFRFAPRSAEYVPNLVVTAPESRDDWVGHFAVVDERRVRMRPLPRGSME